MWDDAGRLKTLSCSGQIRATYHYDHKHRRTRKVSAAAAQDAKAIVYHYDDRDRLWYALCCLDGRQCASELGRLGELGFRRSFVLQDRASRLTV